MKQSNLPRIASQKVRILRLTRGAVVAAMYVALTYVSVLLGLASGNIQCRLSEALCILPAFFPEAIPGLAVGCLISNLISVVSPFDVIFGTLATLIGAVGAYALRNVRFWFLIPAPTVLSNMLIVPAVLVAAYGEPWSSYPLFALQVGIGEVISAGVLGTVLYFALRRTNLVRHFQAHS